MDYKNDNRTPRDRITGEFLSELLFTELGGDNCLCNSNKNVSDCSCENIRSRDNRSQKTSAVVRNTSVRNCNCRERQFPTNTDAMPKHCSGGNVELTGNYSLVMAYVQMQKFGELFDLEEGLCEGTIFKQLRFPFYPTPCRRESD